ncbi:thiamine phosphate synthase [Hephaestia sp. GCM10023244]|uniref:thiamine phosphate synthase n=1 Tax=unclassified Hephaestia TaxID=2631281 RepID=UPI0020772A2C|nr:thiamine phosphate synthase [Hephaestia sp. MAHUQ-44]MCM8731137.1 thiamine phosphate synthase [Hephaestia sp. MAHUQ-44]
MTDERLGDGLWTAIDKLPPGGGIVFRHYRTPLAKRRRLFAAIQEIADRRGLLLVRAGADRLAAREDGLHNAARRPEHGLLSRAVHSRREALAATRAGADLIFVSPVFTTRSHPGAAALGLARARAIARHFPGPTIALGGVTPARGRRMMRFGFYGWAAIDAWIAD